MTHYLEISDTPPSEIAIVSAIKADIQRLLKGLSDKHTTKETKIGDGKAQTRKAINLAVARGLLADHLNSDAMEVIDAVLECDRVNLLTCLGYDVDYETPTSEVVTSAEHLAEITSHDCAQHLGVSE